MPTQGLGPEMIVVVQKVIENIKEHPERWRCRIPQRKAWCLLTELEVAFDSLVQEPITLKYRYTSTYTIVISLHSRIEDLREDEGGEPPKHVFNIIVDQGSYDARGVQMELPQFLTEDLLHALDKALQSKQCQMAQQAAYDRKKEILNLAVESLEE